MKYVTNREITIDVAGKRVLLARGEPLDGIDAGQLESMRLTGAAINADDFVADVAIASDETASDDSDDSQQSSDDAADVALASLGLSQSILEALSAEGIETVADALDYLDENPDAGFDAISGIGDSSDQKIRAAIGLGSE